MPATVRRGEVYQARFAAFPQEKGTTGKERPVVILQDDEDNVNSHYPFVIVAPISSQKVRRIYKQDVFVPQGTAGLTADSKILIGVLRTIQKTDLLYKVGTLLSAQMEEVNLKLLRQMGFLER